MDFICRMLPISLIIFSLSSAFAEHIPALIWSQSRPLSDLPQSYSGQTIDTDNFRQSYLKPLLADEKHNVVVFLQDKLSLEDFTTHADVYNPSSDGGVFKNVKSAMDDQFSVHLPLVKDPSIAVEKLVNGFTGEVHKVDNSDDLQSLKLSADKSNLILVTLLPTGGKSDATAFTDNDHMMGRCMHHLNKRGVAYSAIYTAASSSQTEPESGYVGRHLLADIEVGSDGCAFVNETYGGKNDTAGYLIYLCSLGVTVTTEKKGSFNGEMTAESLNVSVVDNTDNGTDFTLTLDNTNMTVEIMLAVKAANREWNTTNSTVSFTNKLDDAFNIDALLHLDVVVGPDRFCFHCSKLSTVWKPKDNMANSTVTINITLNSFQFQPFVNITDGMAMFSHDVWDCVPFFTPPIWMAIITSAVLLMILFFGLTMISNIQTMDRFDDPKGKTVTVTVNE